MGPTSWPRRRSRLGRSWPVNIVTTVTMHMNGNKLPFGSLLTAPVTAAIRSSWMPQPSSQVYRVRLHRSRPSSMDNQIGQSTPLQLKLRTKPQLRNYWIITLTILRSD